MASRRFKTVKNNTSSVEDEIKEKNIEGEILAEDEETHLSFKIPDFKPKTASPPKDNKGFSDKTSSSMASKFQARLREKKLSRPKESDEPKEEIINEVSSKEVIGESSLAKVGRHTNQRVIQTNAKASGKMNLVPSKTSKSEYPYLIDAFNYDEDKVFLWDVDSSLIQLRYTGDLEIELNGHILTKREKDGQMGYFFYKKTKSHIDKLDELFGDNWRNNIKVELPKCEEVNPDILWSGDFPIGNEVYKAELCEYKEKSLALFIEGDRGANLLAKDQGFLPNTRLTHPSGVKAAGYIIGKSSKDGIPSLRANIDVDFGLLYTKSMPVSIKPVSGTPGSNSESLIDTTNIELEEGSFKISFYDYKENSFALIFQPDLDFEQDGFMRNEKLKIKGKNTPGYIIAKTDASTLKFLTEDLAPNLIVTISTPTPMTDSALDIIPKTGGDRLEILLPKLVKLLSKCEDGKMEIIESKGVTYLIGDLAKIENFIEDSDVEYDLVIQGQINDDVGYFALKKQK